MTPGIVRDEQRTSNVVRDERIPRRKPPKPKPHDPINYVGHGVRHGWVALETVSLPLAVTVMMSDQPKWTTVSGQFDRTARVRRKSLTTFKGNDPKTVTLALLFDAYATQASVEGPIRQLELMAEVPDHEHEPPQIKLDGGGAIPHDYTRNPSLCWRIDSFEWGDAEWNDAGRRCRQAVNVTFVEDVNDDSIRRLMTPARSKRKHPKTYKLKKGDTLQKIAKHFYGTAKAWKKIAKANDIRDPNHPGKPGRKIKLP